MRAGRIGPLADANPSFHARHILHRNLDRRTDTRSHAVHAQLRGKYRAVFLNYPQRPLGPDLEIFREHRVYNKYNTYCVYIFTATRSQSTPPPAWRFHLVRIIFHTRVLFFFCSYYSPTVARSVSNGIYSTLLIYVSYLRFYFFVFNPSQIELRCLPYTVVAPISLTRVSLGDFRVHSFFSPFFLRYCIKSKREKFLTKRVWTRYLRKPHSWRSIMTVERTFCFFLVTILYDILINLKCLINRWYAIILSAYKWRFVILGIR